MRTCPCFASGRFDRDLARLSPRVATAIVEFVTAVLPENVSRMTRPLTGGLEGYRSARRGDYRVLVRLDDSAHVVVLHRVAHRAHVVVLHRVAHRERRFAPCRSRTGAGAELNQFPQKRPGRSGAVPGGAARDPGT